MPNYKLTDAGWEAMTQAPGVSRYPFQSQDTGYNKLQGEVISGSILRAIGESSEGKMSKARILNYFRGDRPSGTLRALAQLESHGLVMKEEE